jgi:hypothetical protein
MAAYEQVNSDVHYAWAPVKVWKAFDSPGVEGASCSVRRQDTVLCRVAGSKDSRSRGHCQTIIADAYAVLVRQRLEEAQEGDGGATQFTRDSVPATSNPGRPHTSVAGPILQRAILLTGELNDEIHHAAVVVVDASARAVTTREQHELLRAIASYLLSVGDTAGVPANDS